MKTISTAVTRPRSSSGVTSGRIVCRNTTLTRSTPPLTASAASESHIDRDSPKTIMQIPNAVTTPRSFRPAYRPIGRRASRTAATSAPAAGALRSTPETGRADVQDVPREHREQRDGSAEQHREEIERDRAEHHRCPADQPDAGEDALETGRVGRTPAAGRRA